MRWFVFAVATVLAPLGADAYGQVADPAPALVATPVAAPEPVATVNLIPPGERTDEAAGASTPSVPAAAIPVAASTTLAALSRPVNFDSEIRRAKRQKARKAARLNRSLLSRTARYQVALLAARPKAGEVVVPDLFNRKDADSGIDATDLHVAYSRPRPIADDDQADEAGISGNAKFRLLMARLRAVEALELAQAADRMDDAEVVSETVKLRLFLARSKALQAHRDRYG